MELKDTLLMPKGTFEMRGNLPTKEPLMVKRFEEMDLYHAREKKNEGGECFYLHDGPPYANNDIHAGHALNKTVKDILLRYKSLKGYSTPNTPGWDTHGLPIELAVTKKGADRRKMSPVEFRKLCTEFAIEQVERQKAQMKRLGVISDWDQPYLTLNPSYEKAQIEVFADMALKGYIYRGLKPVNWSYSSETALAEAEIEYADVKSTAIYVSFVAKTNRGPIKAGDSFVIWTTTPWTIPANLAVCLNEKLEYGIYQTEQGRLIFLTSLSETLIEKLKLTKVTLKATFKGAEAEGLLTQHPLFDRDSLVITGDHVTSDAGTGCVHTAPGHGQDDYKVCLKYGIKPFCPVDARGVMTQEAGERLSGLFYERANDVVLTMLAETGSLLFQETIVHSYPHDWRTHKPLIFRATTQWFASLSSFKEPLLKAIKEIEFKPAWGQNRLEKMIENRDDWCISRQRAWGVPIPIIYNEDGSPIIEKEVFDHIAKLVNEHGSSIWYELDPIKLLPEGYKNSASPNDAFTKETDIMDVWFDSGTSFKSVDLGQGRPFPADLYLEGNDQYRGWYNASIILSFATTGKAPFKKVVTHGMMVDSNGEKFSKSKGNGVDPNKVCSTFGADIFRLWTSLVDFTQETKLSDELLKITSESYRKIRNTFKFMLANLYDSEGVFATIPDGISLKLIDKMIINKLAEVIKIADAAYEKLDYNVAINAILNFMINDLSAFYLDISKDPLYCDAVNSISRKAIQSTFMTLIKSLAVALNPIIPFTTEEINDHLPANVKTPGSIALSNFPDLPLDEKLLNDYNTLLKVKAKINLGLEELRQQKEIANFNEAKVMYSIEPGEENLKTFDEVELARLLGVASFAFSSKTTFSKLSGFRCDRCWNTFEQLLEVEGMHLCPRCKEAISEK